MLHETFQLKVCAVSKLLLKEKRGQKRAYEKGDGEQKKEES